jgi:hypothetical protein
MAVKLTRLTHKIAIQLHLVAESCTTWSSRSSRLIRKLLDTPSFVSLIAYRSLPIWEKFFVYLKMFPQLHSLCKEQQDDHCEWWSRNRPAACLAVMTMILKWFHWLHDYSRCNDGNYCSGWISACNLTLVYSNISGCCSWYFEIRLKWSWDCSSAVQGNHFKKSVGSLIDFLSCTVTVEVRRCI